MRIASRAGDAMSAQVRIKWFLMSVSGVLVIVAFLTGLARMK